MNPRHILLVAGKELREALRDRRTLAVLILLPLVVYPLLTLLVAQVVDTREKERESEPSKVALLGEGGRETELRAVLAADPKQFTVVVGGTRDDLDQGRLDALLGLDEKGTSKLVIYFHASRDNSRLAEDRLSSTVGKLMPPHCEPRFSLQRENLSPTQQVGGYLLSKALPLFVILMVLMGAFHPAIDVTAGERERGTLETLLVAPMLRTDLLLGKILAVTVLATLTGVSNLGSMAATLLRILRMAGPELSVPWGNALLMGLVILPAAFLFASLFVALGATARTHKEAQHLLLPVYFLTVAPALAGSMGNFPLTPAWALVPGLNLTLLARDLLAGGARLGPSLMVLLATVVHAALALRFGARFYDSERLVLSPPKYRPTDPPRDPSMGDALALYAIAFFLFLYVFLPLQLRHLTLGLLASQWVGLLGLVAIYAKRSRRTLVDVLHFHRPAHSLAWVAALLIGCSAWLWVGALSDWLVPTPKALLDELRKIIVPGNGGRGLAMTLFLVALTPAVCEEALFRGPILRGLLSRLPPPSAMLVTGLLFGLLHLDPYRLLPTTILGILLSFLALASGSILPAMLAHLCNNAILVLLAHGGFDDALDHLGDTTSVLLLGSAVLCTIVGIALARRSLPPDKL